MPQDFLPPEGSSYPARHQARRRLTTAPRQSCTYLRLRGAAIGASDWTTRTDRLFGAFRSPGSCRAMEVATTAKRLRSFRAARGIIVSIGAGKGQPGTRRRLATELDASHDCDCAPILCAMHQIGLRRSIRQIATVHSG